MRRRGHRDTDYLFRQYDFFSNAHAWKEKLKEAIDKADPSTVKNGTVEEAAESFVNEFRVEAPELTEGAISVDVEETKVDVSHDFRYGHFGNGPTYAPGIRASYFVPFTGDPQMFRVKPSTFSTGIPVAAIEKSELRFTFERPGQDVAETKQAFDDELRRVKEYLGWLRENFNTYNREIVPIAQDRIKARRARLDVGPETRQPTLERSGFSGR